MADAERSRAARAASERALVRVVHHYGARAASGWGHAGTTDVDVQVDLEVACGAVNTARLENALRNAEFEPDTDRVWRWVAGYQHYVDGTIFEVLIELPSLLLHRHLSFHDASTIRGDFQAGGEGENPKVSAQRHGEHLPARARRRHLRTHRHAVFGSDHR